MVADEYVHGRAPEREPVRLRLAQEARDLLLPLVVRVAKRKAALDDHAGYHARREGEPHFPGKVLAVRCEPFLVRARIRRRNQRLELLVVGGQPLQALAPGSRLVEAAIDEDG